MRSSAKTKIITVAEADPETDLNYLLADQLRGGWKLASRTYELPEGYKRGPTRLEFTAVPLPAEKPDDNYYDPFEGQQYFEYDGDTKATFC